MDVTATNLIAGASPTAGSPATEPQAGHQAGPQAEPSSKAEQSSTVPDEANHRLHEKRQRKQPGRVRTWLEGDPFRWVGRKIRRKKDGKTYTVENVFRNERVELERSWMIYWSNVQSIRADYEAA